MIQRIAEHGVAPSNKRREGTDVRHVAGCPHQCIFRFLEPRQMMLQRLMRRQRAGDQTRCARARPVAFDRLLRRHLEARIARQAKVIVVRKNLQPRRTLPNRAPQTVRTDFLQITRQFNRLNPGKTGKAVVAYSL